MGSQDGIKKRVKKACARCRLKKSKCDGGSPCSSCVARNAICTRRERRRQQPTAIPKGYVEMLEQQQMQLVAGLRELYARLQHGDGWPGEPLRETSNGHPLTHDILERLDLLQPSSRISGLVEGSGYCTDQVQDELSQHERITSDWGHFLATPHLLHEAVPATGPVPVLTLNAQDMDLPMLPRHSSLSQHRQMVSQVQPGPNNVRSTCKVANDVGPSGSSTTAWPTTVTTGDGPFGFGAVMCKPENLYDHDQNVMVNTTTDNLDVDAITDWCVSIELGFDCFFPSAIVI